MAPAAPARLSTTTGCPSGSAMCCAMSRPMVSTAPPGGHGTTILIGLFGYCACAAAATSAKAAKATRLRRAFIGSSGRDDGVEDSVYGREIQLVNDRDPLDLEHQAFQPHGSQGHARRRVRGVGKTGRPDGEVGVQRLGRAVALVEALALHEVVHRRAVFVEDLADEFHRDARLRLAIVRGDRFPRGVAGVLAAEE